MGEQLSAQAWRDAQNGLNDHVRRVSGELGTFRVHYWGAAPGLLSNRLHKHSFFEVCCCSGGEGTYHEEGRSYAIRTGTMFCSRPGVQHQITVAPEAKLFLLFVAFEPETAAKAAGGADGPEQEHALCTKPEPAANGEGAAGAAALAEAYERLAGAGRILWVDDAGDTAVAHLWEALLREAAASGPGTPAAASAVAYALIASFPQLFAPELLQHAQSRPPARLTHGLVEQAKLLMRDNLAEPLRLAHVADYLHVSVRHLSRLFQEQQGQPIGEWLRKERVRHGAELLADTRLSIKEIAERTGLGSVHYFTRVFTKEMGLPPAAFRSRGVRR